MEWIIFIVVTCGVAACTFFLGRKFASKSIEDNNYLIEQRKEELNKELDSILDKLKTKQNEEIIKLDTIQSKLKQAEEKNRWVEQQYKERLDVIANTQKLADEEYEKRTSVLDIQYKEKEHEYQDELEQWKNKIQSLKDELESLKNTKAAAIEAAKKESMTKENKNSYSLILSKPEEVDISLLRDAQEKISKPRAIAMCIWSNYYQPIAKNVFPKILGSKDAVCGIYKITNQKTGECYIGQSVDIRKRWGIHCQKGLGVDTPQDNKLYNAMQEYGLEQFTFELVEQCAKDELNKKEKYYIELYNAKVFGYNSQGGNSG